MNFSIKQQENDILPGIYVSGNKEPENKRIKHSVVDFISEVNSIFSDFMKMNLFSKINFYLSFSQSASDIISDVWSLGLLHYHYLW